MGDLTDQQLRRYARQLVVPQIDVEGQLLLRDAHVLIVGAGGLGVPMAQYLAGAGVGHIRIVDDDRIVLSNLSRQIAFSERDIGELKVEVLAKRICAANDDISVEPCAARFNQLTAEELLRDIDLVLDGTDSMQARLDIDRATYSRQIPWIMGAAVQISGQWSAFDPERHQGCYHCLIADPGSTETASCAELGILGPVVGLVSLHQAILARRYLVGDDLPWGRLHMLDAWSGGLQTLEILAREECALCRHDTGQH